VSVMCNDYRLEVGVRLDPTGELWSPIAIETPEGIPNLAPRADIKITDTAPIVRSGASRLRGELVQRRWSWPAPNKKPVYNFRSEGREFGSGRCLIIADGFYEFTASADPKSKRKDRWLFTAPGDEMLGIAGLVRSTPDVGEAFTMLTTEPGADVAPYHSRQVALLAPDDWKAWLDGSAAARDVLKPLPEGTLTVRPSAR